MIIVKVELWSAITGQKTELARMQIDNVGGTRTRGDYHVGTFRGRRRDALDRSLMAHSYVREGVVVQHQRLSLHVWHLVAKALAAMGYGQ